MYFVYSHRADLDGVASAAIMKRFLESKNERGKIDFVDYSSRDLDRTFGEIAALPKGSTVVIADFGLDAEVAHQATRAIKSLNSNGGNLIWLDHHKWSDDVKSSMKQIAELTVVPSSKYCGAELTFMRFMGTDDVSKALAALGRDSDLDMWLHEPPRAKYSLTIPLRNLITYYNHIASRDNEKKRELLNGLVDQLSRLPAAELLRSQNAEDLLDAKSRKDLQEYNRLESESLAQLTQRAQRVQINGHDVVISLSTGVASGSVSASHLSTTFKPDIIFVLFEGGSVTIRRRDESVKCNEIANQLSGGGHEFAAGGRIPMKIRNDSDYTAAVEYLQKKLETILPQKAQQKSKST